MNLTLHKLFNKKGFWDTLEVLGHDQFPRPVKLFFEGITTLKSYPNRFYRAANELKHLGIIIYSVTDFGEKLIGLTEKGKLLFKTLEGF